MVPRITQEKKKSSRNVKKKRWEGGLFLCFLALLFTSLSDKLTSTLGIEVWQKKKKT